MAQALVRRRGLDENDRRRREKQRKKKREKRRRRKLNRAARKQGDDTQQPAHASVKPKKTTSPTGSQKKVAGGEVSPVGTVHQNYIIATRLISQITPKFV